MGVPRDGNIVLIGMPGAGKSTVGVLLAKELSREFIDTDLIVQAAEHCRLQDIIDARGLEAFRAIEERHVCAIEARDAVIATGGSVPYSGKAMAHLKGRGRVVYLRLPLETVRERITNMDSRGIAMNPGQTLEGLYGERTPLYEQYADTVVDCEGLSHEEAVAGVKSALGY